MIALFSALFFSLLAIAAWALIFGMLNRSVERILAVLSGRELAVAQAQRPVVRIRARGWARAELRREVPVRHAAAA